MTHSGTIEFEKTGKWKINNQEHWQGWNRKLNKTPTTCNECLLLTMHSYVRNEENLNPNCLCSTRQKYYIIYLAEINIFCFFFAFFSSLALCSVFLRNYWVLFGSFSFRLYFCSRFGLCFWCRCYTLNDYHDDEWRHQPSNARNNVCAATRQQSRWA